MERLGGRLFHFPWCDDFSAARNVAIDAATSDWMLYIDADERVRPCDMDRLRAELADSSLLLGRVEFRPRTGFTAYRELRLIRRHPDIRFEGAMHESVRPSVQRLVAEGQGRMGPVSLALDHIGYDGDQSHKFDRNLRLLDKQIAAAPTRAYLRWHLGTVQRDLGDMAAAEETWRIGAALALAVAKPIPEDVLCFLELARLALERGADPTEWLQAGEIVHPGDWMMLWLRGKARLAAADWDAAEAVFARLGGIDPDTMVDEVAYDRRIFGAYALADLAEAAFAAGDFKRAADWFARAEAVSPQALEFRTKRHLAALRAARTNSA